MQHAKLLSAGLRAIHPGETPKDPGPKVGVEK